MPRDDFRCVHELRVRWAEVDMQKVVFNAHYLTYIDSAIAQYWREIGLPYPEGYVDRYGADLYLRKATIEYLGSARYDDELSVLCRVADLGRTSLTMQFEIWRDGRRLANDAPPAEGHEGIEGREGRDLPTPALLLVTADLVYVNVEVATGRSAALPEDLRNRVRDYERVTARTAAREV